MNKKEIQLSLTIIQELLHHAQSSVDREVCGLIGVKDGRVQCCYPVKNSDSNPQCKFTLDVAEQIRVFKILREKGEQLFAIYHSHPHSEAYPSATDLALVNYPKVLYLIISLSTKGVLELRGFNLVNDQVEEVILIPYS
jgi:proteasome lid subunit RPN8/RPN11